MRAIVQDVPDSWLEERARRGLDRFDEMWEGVLHMIPPPSYLHQKIGTRLVSFLASRLAARGLEVLYETGVHRAKSDYRVPDLVFFPADRTEIIGELGLVGAPLAVLEIRSPGDETWDKLDFWAALGVPEVLVIEPETRKVEVYRLAGPRYLATSADEQGRIHAATIDIRLSTTEGPRLRVELAGETCEI